MSLRSNLMGLLSLVVTGVPLLSYLLGFLLCSETSCGEEAGVAMGLMIVTSPLAVILALIALSMSMTVSAKALAYVSLAVSTVLLWVSCETFMNLG